MPPAMQLQDKRPRHPNRPLHPRQPLTDHLIDVPQHEARDEEHGTPFCELSDFSPDGFVVHAEADYGAGFVAYGYYHEAWFALGRFWGRVGKEGERREGGLVPNKMECMISSLVMQCQVMKAAIRMAEMSPEVTVRERDLSNVITLWRTVAVAMCIESSSPVCLSVLGSGITLSLSMIVDLVSVQLQIS